ncbi:hypothetical protein ACJX0J_034659, partial [Zea mays]
TISLSWSPNWEDPYKVIVSQEKSMEDIAWELDIIYISFIEKQEAYSNLMIASMVTVIVYLKTSYLLHKRSNPIWNLTIRACHYNLLTRARNSALLVLLYIAVIHVASGGGCKEFEKP